MTDEKNKELSKKDMKDTKGGLTGTENEWGVKPRTGVAMDSDGDFLTSDPKPGPLRHDPHGDES